MAPRKPTATAPRRTSERLQLAKVVEASKTDTKIIKKKRFRRPQQRKSCHFLKIPGEIRNQIYEYAVVAPRVVLKANGPGEPAILRVCNRIRKEASSIYYTANNFELRLVDFNGAAFTPFYHQYRRYVYCHPRGAAHTNIKFNIGGSPNFGNLIAWIKDHYTCQSNLQPVLDDPVSRNDYIVDAAFRIAESFDALPNWVPWASVEKALRAYQYGLKGTCSSWATVDDGDDLVLTRH
ncbi:hypothetical protein LTS10_006442 [Elasticomyces elasticus]|nr:hypothetical protein LTS10_006442 [Elasticomyces elasticus]